MTAPAASAARGALVGVATVLAERALAFLVVLALARTLTPAAFGRYGYVLAGMALVQVLADQGIEVAAVARMAAAPASTPAVLGAALLLRLGVWLALAVPVGVLVLPALAADGDAPLLGPVGLAASALVVLGPSLSVRGALRAHGAMGAMARVALADAALGALAVVSALAAGAGLATLFAVRALASIVVTAAAFALGPHRPALAGGGDPAVLRRLWRVALPLGGNALLIAIQSRAGHLVAMALAGPVVVGLLGVAARLTEVLAVLPEGALLALFPRMAAGPAAAPALAATAARRIAVPVLAAVVLLAVGAAPIATTIFGDAYAPAAPAIAVLVWIAPLAVTGGVVLHALVARGAERRLVSANVVAAVVGVALQVVLVRRFGLVGAAAATVATAAVGQAALLLPAATRPVVTGVWRAAAPLLACAVVAVVAGRAVRPDLAGAAVATAAFLAALVGLGLVRRDDWHALREALRRTPGA